MEQWRTVVYNDEIWEDYEVSNCGNVRNVKTGKLLKLYEQGRYLQVGLRKNSKTTKYLVHRVVGYTWIPNDNPTVKTIVHHKDHNTYNNSVDNLQWISQQENIEEGRGKRVRCVETGQIYESTIEVERQTGISNVSVHYCCTGKRQTTHGFHFEYVD